MRGKIIAAGVKRFKKGTRAMFECVFDDGTARLHCRWWQAQPWMEDWFTVGREFLVFGKPDSLKPRNIDHPETELVEPGEDEFIHVNRIVPGASADRRPDGARDADARLARAGEICSRASESAENLSNGARQTKNCRAPTRRGYMALPRQRGSHDPFSRGIDGCGNRAAAAGAG